MTGARRVPFVCVAAALLALAAGAQETAGAGESAGQGELVTLPYPMLDDHDAPVREQLQAARSRLDELLDTPGVPAGTLAEAFGEVGRLYHLYDLGDLAVASLRNAVTLAPEDYRWSYYLGASLTYMGSFEEAVASLERADELHPGDLATTVRLGDLQIDLQEVEAAEGYYRRALELDPDCAAAIYGMGRVAYYGGDLEGAVALFERALELQPEATSIHQLLGMAYRRLGDLEQARHHLELNRDDPVIFPDPLINRLGQLIRSTQVHFKAGVDALKAGDYDTAIGYFETVLSSDPDDHVAHYNLAMALVQKGDSEGAKREFRAAVEIEPGFRNGHLNLATLLVGEERYEEAAVHFERAHEIDPENLTAHLEWATALTKIGQDERAAEELGKLLEREPQSARARLYLGTLQAKRGQRAEAQRNLAAVLELDATAADRAEACFQLGVLHLSLGDHARSFQYFEQAVALDPAAQEPRLALAQGLGRAGRFAESAEHFSKVIDESPERLEAHFGRGMALLLGEDYAGARRALEDSLADLPGNTPLRHLLARLLATCPDAAVRDGERALALAGELFRTQQTLEHAATLAMALAEVGRFPQAVELQRQVVAQQSQLGGAEAARRHLAAYERGEPVRAPWKGQ